MEVQGAELPIAFSLPHILSNLRYLRHCLLTFGSTLPTVFSMLLQVLGKYWHCWLRNLRIDSCSHVEGLQKAHHERHIGAPRGGHRQSCLYGFLKCLCLGKCHLASCPYARRSSSNPKAPCLPWLRRELAFGGRDKGRGPKTVVFPCWAGAEFKTDQPTFYRLFPVRLFRNWLPIIHRPSSRAFLASSLRHSNSPKAIYLPSLRSSDSRL